MHISNLSICKLRPEILTALLDPHLHAAMLTPKSLKEEEGTKNSKLKAYCNASVWRPKWNLVLFFKLGKIGSPTPRYIPKLPACSVKIWNFVSSWPAGPLAEGKITSAAQHCQDLSFGPDVRVPWGCRILPAHLTSQSDPLSTSF